MIKQIEKSLRLVLDPATNKILGQGVFINDYFVFIFTWIIFVQVIFFFDLSNCWITFFMNFMYSI